MTLNPGSKEQTRLLLTCLFLWEVSIGVMVVAISVNGDRSLTLLLTSPSGWVFLPAVGMAGLTTAMIVRQYVISSRVGSSHLRLTVAMNLIMVMVILMTGEVAVRLGTSSSTEGVEKWRWKVLVPKNWEKVALSYRQLLDRGTDHLSLSGCTMILWDGRLDQTERALIAAIIPVQREYALHRRVFLTPSIRTRHESP